MARPRAHLRNETACGFEPRGSSAKALASAGWFRRRAADHQQQSADLRQ